MRYDIHRISSIIYQLFQNDQNLFFKNECASSLLCQFFLCLVHSAASHHTSYIIHHIHHISHTYISNTYLIHISYVHIPYITYLHPTSNIQRGCFYNNYSRTIKTFFLKRMRLITTLPILLVLGTLYITYITYLHPTWLFLLYNNYSRTIKTLF